MKSTLLTLRSGSDYWIVLHRGGRADVAGFFTEGDTSSNDAKELIAAANVFFNPGGLLESKDFEVPFKIVEDPAFEASLTSPKTGIVYKGDCEGDALKSLLADEPDTILAFSTQDDPRP